MKPRSVLLPTFLLIPLLTFSQGGYPKKVILGSDTVCAITIDQVDTINSTFVQLDGCQELLDNSNRQIDALEYAQEQSNKIVLLHKQKEAVYERINAEYEIQIDSYQAIQTKVERKIKWLRFQRNGLAIGVGVVGVLYLLK